jgi:O-antigen/teichoic acid export membrane protein
MGTIVNQISMFLFVLLLARTLSVVELGRSLVVIATATLLAALADFGTNSKWLIDLAAKTLSPASWLRLASAKILYTAFIFLTGSAFTICLGINTFPTIAILIGLLSHQTLLVYLKVFDLNKWYALLSGGERTLALCVLIVSYLTFKNTSDFYWAALGIGTFLCSALALLIILRHIAPADRNAPNLSRVPNPWVRSGSFAATSLAGATRSLDVNLVNWVGGSHSAGLFGAVSKWVQPLIVGAGITSTITTPWVASQGNPTKSDVFKAFAPLIVTLLFSLPILLAPNWLVQTLLGSDFSASATLLLPLFLGASFAGLSILWGSWAQAEMGAKTIAYISIAQVMIQFVVGGLALAEWGVVAYTWVACISQAFAALASFYVFKKSAKN